MLLTSDSRSRKIRQCLNNEDERRKCLRFNNNALNARYLWIYGVGHMVKDHSDTESLNLTPALHGLLFPISSKGCFICTISYYIPRPLLHQ